MVKVLGIDHATVHAGASVKQGAKFLCFDAIDLREYEDVSPMRALFDIVGNYIKHYKPDVCALEKPMDNRNGDTTRKLTEVYAACKLAVELHGIPVIEVMPNTAKLAVTGNGHAEKEDVARAIAMQFKLPLDAVAPPVYYVTGKKKGHLKDRLWDVSDSMAICVAAEQIIKLEKLEAK